MIPGVAKLLIVDDLDKNLVALGALLARDDVEVLKARTGLDALDLLLKNDVALAVVDVRMPEMDGFELAELMRGAERTRRVPIIFITADLGNEARVFEGYDAGAVDFLFKPIDGRILRHKVAVFLQLYHQRRALEQTLRLSEELMAIVGHDLRNPLNAILMTASVLASAKGEPHALAAAPRLRTTGMRMDQILNDLLDLSRARIGGGIPVTRGPVDLLSVATKIVAELQAAFPSRMIELFRAGDLCGEWDDARLGQVLSNLMGNALRHGDRECTVVIDLDGRADSEVRVSVHNDGDIPKDAMSRLFEPFHQGERRHAPTAGLGLGLYIVRQVVLAHGGDVGVSSGMGSGTTFRVRLPRVPEHDPQARGSSA